MYYILCTYSVGLGDMIRNERTSNSPEKRNWGCAVLNQRFILLLLYKVPGYGGCHQHSVSEITSETELCLDDSVFASSLHFSSVMLKSFYDCILDFSFLGIVLNLSKLCKSVSKTQKKSESFDFLNMV